MDSVNLMLPAAGVFCLLIFAGWILTIGNDSLAQSFATLKVGIVACGALLAAPVCFYMTWQQFGAKARLQAEHIPPCHALGWAEFAQGGRAPRYVWRFVALDESTNIFRYYETECAKSGWKVERRKNGMLLTRDGARFAIWAEKSNDKQNIIFQKNPPNR